MANAGGERGMHIIILGSFDSKFHELQTLHRHVEKSIGDDPDRASSVRLIDISRKPILPDLGYGTSSETLTEYHPDPEQRRRDSTEMPRGEYANYMIACGTEYLRQQYATGERPLHGVIAAGGSSGTSIAAAIMREALPIGLPKLIVSTVASGDTGPLVGECDITMMYSVADIAGQNWLLDNIFANAAGAIVGMARTYSARCHDQQLRTIGREGDLAVQRGQRGKRKKIGITMFGVTTPCVDQIRDILTLPPYDYEVLVFHATGHGGKAMERLVRDRRLDAILDVTTTEICDHLCGGVMSAGPDRLEAAAKAGIPCVVSVGATDMVNFGPIATVLEEYKGRKLFEHNPTVTLMRTSKDDCAGIGKFIADKIRRFAQKRDKLRVVMPTGGVSIISTAGGPFEDFEADACLRREVWSGLEGTGVSIIEDKNAINDQEFSELLAKQLVDVLENQRWD